MNIKHKLFLAFIATNAVAISIFCLQTSHSQGEVVSATEEQPKTEVISTIPQTIFIAKQEKIVQPIQIKKPVGQVMQQAPKITYPQIKISENATYSLKHVIDKNPHGCSDDLLGLEQYEAIHNLWVMPLLCIKYIPSTLSNIKNKSHSAHGVYLGSNNNIEVYTDKNKTLKLKKATLLHELCHANQYYYIRFKSINNKWHTTEAGKEFIQITGYSLKNNFWHLESSSPYKRMYNKNPFELGAEVCSIFLSPEIYNNRYTEEQMNIVLNNRELRQWFNKYIRDMSALPTQAMNIFYDANGQVQYKVYYRADGVKERYEIYRKDGTLEQEQKYRAKGKKEEVSWYRKDGSLDKKQYYREDGSLEQAEWYRKDSSLRQKQYYGTNEEREKVEWYGEDGIEIIKTKQYN